MRWIGRSVFALLLAVAFYLLLIDTTDLPELYVLAAVAVLAALAFEASCETAFAEVRPRARWLLQAWRAVVRVPVHIALVSWDALLQVVELKPARGSFRAIPFDAGSDTPNDAGRRALSEALGSLAPNTIVVGVDRDRNLLLVHQLHRQGGAEELDPLRLG